jgi:hypothetical protein
LQFGAFIGAVVLVDCVKVYRWDKDCGGAALAVSFRVSLISRSGFRGFQVFLR